MIYMNREGAVALKKANADAWATIVAVICFDEAAHKVTPANPQYTFKEVRLHNWGVECFKDVVNVMSALGNLDGVGVIDYDYKDLTVTLWSDAIIMTGREEEE